MSPPVVLAYVGDADHSLSVSRVLRRRAERDLHLLTVSPDDVDSVVTDDRLDGLVCGGRLDGDQLQSVVDTADEAGVDTPVFDLSNEVAAVPATVEMHHLYPATDADAVADEILDVVGSGDPATTGEVIDRAHATAGSDGASEGASGTAASREASESEARAASEGASGTAASREAGGSEATVRTGKGMEPTVTVDGDWRVVDWDSRLDDRLALDADEAAGARLGEAFPALAGETVRSLGERVRGSGEPDATELRVDDEWFELRAVPAGEGLVWFLRDVTERKRYEREMEQARERLEDTLDRITDAFFVLDTDEEFVLLNSRAEFVLDVDADEVVGERFWDVFPAAVSTTFYHEFTEAMETQDPTSFEEYYRPLDAWFEVNAYPSEDGLSVFLRDVTEQVRLQKKLEALHDTTQELIVAESDREIGEEAVRAAVDVLDFPLTVCWRYDETTRRLQPLASSEAVTDRVEDVQPVEPDSGMAWDAYDDSQLRVIDSVTIVTPNSHHPGDVNSALLVPLGEYGLLGTYATEEAAFDETDTELFRILATSVESAMARAKRERQLARRNERLNDFASTVSHDLRNPLHIASARTELARDTGDVAHLDEVADALERMETLIEDLLERARGERDLDRETVSLAAAAEDAWGGVDTGTMTLEVADDAAFSADATRLKQVFENLYRNAAEHGSTSPDSRARQDAVEHGSTGSQTQSDDAAEHGVSDEPPVADASEDAAEHAQEATDCDVTVTVGVHDGGFYVADDGPGIPEGERDEVFEQGVTDSEEGTGYGLAIVSEIVEGHGWTIEATESASGGARFEVHHIHSLSDAEHETA